MPKRSKGYISVRNCVDSDTMSVNAVMEVFNKEYSICSKCEGRGFQENDIICVVPGITTVKWKDIEVLENLNNSGNLNGETIKKIIEVVIHNRKQCNKCNGFGFVKKSRKKNGSKKT